MNTSDVILGILSIITVLPAVGIGLFKYHKNQLLKECEKLEKELSTLKAKDLTEEETQLINQLRAYIKQGKTDDITLKVCDKDEKERLLSEEDESDESDEKVEKIE